MARHLGRQLRGTARAAEVSEDEVLGTIILGKCPAAATPALGAVEQARFEAI